MDDFWKNLSIQEEFGPHALLHSSSSDNSYLRENIDPRALSQSSSNHLNFQENFGPSAFPQSLGTFNSNHPQNIGQAPQYRSPYTNRSSALGDNNNSQAFLAQSRSENMEGLEALREDITSEPVQMGEEADMAEDDFDDDILEALPKKLSSKSVRSEMRDADMDAVITSEISREQPSKNLNLFNLGAGKLPFNADFAAHFMVHAATMELAKLNTAGVITGPEAKKFVAEFRKRALPTDPAEANEMSSSKKQKGAPKNVKAAHVVNTEDAAATDEECGRQIAVPKPKPKPKHTNRVQHVPEWFLGLDFSSEAFTPFMQSLSRAVLHIARTGGIVHELHGSSDWYSVKPDANALKEVVYEYGETNGIKDPQFLRYLEITLSCFQAGDKYMPLRMLAPSMKLVSKILPPYDASASEESLRLGVFQLAGIRIFGVGNQSLVRSMATVSTADEMLNFAESSFVSPTSSTVQRLVYGNLQIHRGSLRNIVDCSEKMAKGLAKKLKETDVQLTFAEIETTVCSHRIPYMKQGTILLWLFICDLAAFGYCSEATYEDLSRKVIGQAKDSKEDEGGSGPEAGIEPVKKGAKEGGSGPKAGIELVKKDAKLRATDVIDKDTFIQACEIVAATLNEEFGEEFRKMGIDQGILPRDMEHFLCKISRLNGRGKFDPPKTPKTPANKKPMVVAEDADEATATTADADEDMPLASASAPAAPEAPNVAAAEDDDDEYVPLQTKNPRTRGEVKKAGRGKK